MDDHLITAAELIERRTDPALRIGDVRWYLGEADRARAAYHEGHIPGAVFVDLERHVTSSGPGRHPMPSREEAAATLGALGFGDGTLAVLYDDRGGAIAARVWWMLRDAGHGRVRLLDGGLPAWVAEGGELSGVASTYEPRPLTVATGPSRRIDREGLAAGLGGLVLLDAREPERYRGDEEPIDPVAGHIPTARNAPYEDNLAPDGTFLDADVLAERYRALGADAGDVVVYCGSGVTACHDVLAMCIAGLPEPTLYPGSWSDWCTSGMAAATGPEPGGA